MRNFFRTSSFVFLFSSQMLIGSENKLSVALVSSYCPSAWPGELNRLKEKFDVKCLCHKHRDNSATQILNQCDKVIFFDHPIDGKMDEEFVKKSIFLNCEPVRFSFDNYYKVLTWNDVLIDGKKYFKLHYPFLKKMVKNIPSFQHKRFISIVASNWVPHRIEILNFFRAFPQQLDIYGKNLPWEFSTTKMYKGPIPGHHSGNEKTEILKKYKFHLCFENTLNLKGYITEKIFAAFTAGSVPVYWGASNIEKYIPSDCYINMKSFESFDRLYEYLQSMDETTYIAYQDAIRRFLDSEKAQVFSIDNFDDMLEKAVLDQDVL